MPEGTAAPRPTIRAASTSSKPSGARWTWNWRSIRAAWSLAKTWALKGGVHAATQGLQSKYGEARVFDTSLSEEGIIGRAVGMALAGLVPVPEIQFRKYADPATEQLNNCGTIRWRSANKFAAPLVVRIPGGYRKIGDPWHSVTSEVTLAHQPGWLLAAPSNAEDWLACCGRRCAATTRSSFLSIAICWMRPGRGGLIPATTLCCLLGRQYVREGDALTVITWGAMVERCELKRRRDWTRRGNYRPAHAGSLG
jgi:2-oxoisovalerate dehydrogenase E1 component